MLGQDFIFDDTEFESSGILRDDSQSFWWHYFFPNALAGSLRRLERDQDRRGKMVEER